MIPLTRTPQARRQKWKCTQRCFHMLPLVHPPFCQQSSLLKIHTLSLLKMFWWFPVSQRTMSNFFRHARLSLIWPRLSSPHSPLRSQLQAHTTPWVPQEQLMTFHASEGLLMLGALENAVLAWVL